jgi:hypothetical protein
MSVHTIIGPSISLVHAVSAMNDGFYSAQPRQLRGRGAQPKLAGRVEEGAGRPEAPARPQGKTVLKDVSAEIVLPPPAANS